MAIFFNGGDDAREYEILRIETKQENLPEFLVSTEGITNLAQTMVADLETELDEKSLLKKVLMDRGGLAMVALPKFNIEPDERGMWSYCKQDWVWDNGEAVAQIVNSNDDGVSKEFVPYFQYAFDKYIKLMELRGLDWEEKLGCYTKSILDNAIQKENEILFTLMDHVIPSDNKIVTDEKDLSILSKKIINEAQLHYNGNMDYLNVLLPMNLNNDAKIFPSNFYKFLNHSMNNSIYFLPQPEKFGSIYERQSLTILPTDDAQKLKIGHVVYKELGLEIHNSAMSWKIDIE